MPTPFPGMDPYLEHPALWKEVHTGLSVAIADALGPQIRPRYRVSVERRAYSMILTPDDYALVSKPNRPVMLPPWQASGAVPVNTSIGMMPPAAVSQNATSGETSSIGTTRSRMPSARAPTSANRCLKLRGGPASADASYRKSAVGPDRPDQDQHRSCRGEVGQPFVADRRLDEA